MIISQVSFSLSFQLYTGGGVYRETKKCFSRAMVLLTRLRHRVKKKVPSYIQISLQNKGCTAEMDVECVTIKET